MYFVEFCFIFILLKYSSFGSGLEVVVEGKFKEWVSMVYLRWCRIRIRLFR